MLTREEQGVATSRQVYRPQESKGCEEEEARPVTGASSGASRRRAGLLPLSAPRTEEKCSLAKEGWNMAPGGNSEPFHLCHLQLGLTAFVLNSSSGSSGMTRSYPETLVRCAGHSNAAQKHCRSLPKLTQTHTLKKLQDGLVRWKPTCSCEIDLLGVVWNHPSSWRIKLLCWAQS